METHTRMLDHGTPPERFARGWHCLGLADSFRDGEPHRIEAFGGQLRPSVRRRRFGRVRLVDRACGLLRLRLDAADEDESPDLTAARRFEQTLGAFHVDGPVLTARGIGLEHVMRLGGQVIDRVDPVERPRWNRAGGQIGDREIGNGGPARRPGETADGCPGRAQLVDERRPDESGCPRHEAGCLLIHSVETRLCAGHSPRSSG